jgi:hypothetical protein
MIYSFLMRLSLDDVEHEIGCKENEPCVGISGLYPPLVASGSIYLGDNDGPVPPATS